MVNITISSVAPPVILTIAGSDSGGGAGIQADGKTMTLLGGFGTSVITSLTAQNGAGVTGVHEVPADFVALQLKMVLEGFPVKAAKTGMLVSPAIIEAIVPLLAARDFPLVVDPVCVSQSGYPLINEDAVESMRRQILPMADLLTPNRPEAEALAGISISSFADVKEAIARLLAMGSRAVLIKGGHFAAKGTTMTDWLGMPGSPVTEITRPYIKTTNNHGTGCTLSAAIATYLGLGYGLETSIMLAGDFLNRALAHAFSPGIGAGPPNLVAGAAMMK